MSVWMNKSIHVDEEWKKMQINKSDVLKNSAVLENISIPYLFKNAIFFF